MTDARPIVLCDVDDKTSAVEEWAAFHPMSYAVRWNTPHNRNDTVTSSVVRTNDWSLVFGLVKELADAAA